MGSLSISVRYADPSVQPNTPLVISGNQGQQWVRAFYNIIGQRPFQFVIEGQVGNGPQSDIAIDDISFSEGCLNSNQSSLRTTTPSIVSSNTNPTISPLTNPSVNSMGTTSQSQLSSKSSNTHSFKSTTTTGADITQTIPVLKRSDGSKPSNNCKFHCY